MLLYGLLQLMFLNQPFGALFLALGIILNKMSPSNSLMWQHIYLESALESFLEANA